MNLTLNGTNFAKFEISDGLLIGGQVIVLFAMVVVGLLLVLFSKTPSLAKRGILPALSLFMLFLFVVRMLVSQMSFLNPTYPSSFTFS
jgi:hypothetical protein